MQSWVQAPQHRQWGWEKARPELLKVVIDLRPKEHQSMFQPPPERLNLSSMLAYYQQVKASDSTI